MREERGTLHGPITISEVYTLWGTVIGDIIVVNGGKFYCRGAILGNLTVEPGGRVHIFGNLHGILTLMPKTKVILSGALVGDAVNKGGRLYIERSAKISGKVKTKTGETQYESANPFN